MRFNIWNGIFLLKELKKIFEGARFFRIEDAREKIVLHNDNTHYVENSLVFYKCEFEKIQNKLTAFSCNSTYIYNENEIERIIIDSTNKIRREYDYDDFSVISLSFEYSIQTPSHELILSLVSLLSDNEICSINRYFLEHEVLYNSRFPQIKLYDFILQILRINCSIKVKAKVDKISLDNFKKHIKSYLYNIAYNLNYLFIRLIVCQICI
ncbi:MAG: hypothetical protein J6M39_05915 [Lachnospiraceae bacterium]|nr:hypothetical protein [Lachnospiraceae bacterium]